MCQNQVSQNMSTIQHFYNEDHDTPDVLDSDNPNVGLTNSVITVNDGYLICKFTRVKKNNSVDNYFDLNNHFYIIGANGPISQSGRLDQIKHLSISTLNAIIFLYTH